MTKFNLKTLAVAVALAAAAGQANAAAVNAQGTLLDGNSSVIMYAYSELLGRSYMRDLGFMLNDFLASGTVAPTAGSYSFNPVQTFTNTGNAAYDATHYSWNATTVSVGAGNATTTGYALNFGTDSLMTSWLGNGTALASDVQWGIAAVDGQGAGANFRALTTVQSGAPSAGTINTELYTFENTLDNFVQAHNFLVDGTNYNNLGPNDNPDFTIGNGSSGSDGTDLVAASAASGFGVNWGGRTSFFAAGGVGESMEFFYMAGNGAIPNTNATAVRYGNAEGFATWTLNSDGSFAYAAPAAVPIPAAVWLFASGLLGLVGISRRKKSV